MKSQFPSMAYSLYSGRVQHHPDSSSHSLRRKVLPKLGSNGTAVSMGTGDLAPYDTQMAWFVMAWTGSLLLSTIDIGALLAKVEIGFRFILDTLNLQQCCILMLVTKSTFKSSKDGLHIQPSWFPNFYDSFSLW